jgi:hypothetical protein
MKYAGGLRLHISRQSLSNRLFNLLEPSLKSFLSTRLMLANIPKSSLISPSRRETFKRQKRLRANCGQLYKAAVQYVAAAARLS